MHVLVLVVRSFSPTLILVANGDFYRNFPHCPTAEDVHIILLLLLSVYLPPSLICLRLVCLVQRPSHTLPNILRCAQPPLLDYPLPDIQS